MTGEQISHYNILEKIGEGGMGVVYKALDTKLDRIVALKFLPRKIGASENEKKRFINEAKSASSLDHANICSIYSIEEAGDGSLFITMAYYDGAPLSGRIENGPLSLKEMIGYSLQIAAGLQKAHEKGIVHRDLKPDNIFITADDQVKIIDFGLARAAGQTLLTLEGTTLGTMPYMSPEQAQGGPVDQRTDIWSLGVVLYEMITGMRPFKSEYESALVYSILNEDPEPVTALRTGVPMELEIIIQKCLEKEAANRYQRADDLIVDLRRVERELSSGSRSVASKPGVQSRNIRTDVAPSRNLTKPLVYALCIVILAAGLFYFTSRKSPGVELIRSIAVLPLANLSPDPDDAYFSAGIHEDIIIQLSQISDLRVIAKSSVMGYATGQRNIRNISNDLGVQTILEGSVRRAANQVRVAVTLTDAQSNRTLWADTYDRNLTDIFAIQSEIAFEIAKALQATLSESEEKQLGEQPTMVAGAYELYLRARTHFSSPGASEENLVHAQNLLLSAVELDPEFAHAYALLSRTYSSLWWFQYRNTAEVRALALQNAEKAFSLQPELADANIAMGYYHYHGYRDYTRALHYFNTALRYQPNNADIISSIGFVQRRLGNLDESITMVDKAIALDPLNINLVFNNANSKMVVRRHEEAEVDFNKVIELAPDLIPGKILLALNRILWKADVEAVNTFFRENPELQAIVPGDWMRLQMIIGDFDGVLQTLHDVPREIYEEQLFLLTPSLMRALSHEFAGNSELAENYFRTALNDYAAMPETYHDDLRYIVTTGRIKAGLGMQHQALEMVDKAIRAIDDLDDALMAPAFMTELAMIYSKLGKPAEAAGLLREILSSPGYMTTSRLKLEPAWNPIRDTIEFQQLIAEFERGG